MTAGHAFAEGIIRWQAQFGRHDLPWQGTHDPYRIWLSEVMLQQTQVRTVIPYYLRFLDRFPDVAALAAAPLDRVMELWSGLGYYSRARNLHRCAQSVVREHEGHFPDSAAALAELPGIGPSTAAAIAAFAFGERSAILDGNVKRLLCRHFGVTGWPGERPVEQRLWAIARRELPERDIERYTQGLMDLGAQTCVRSRPRCDGCPVAASCVARIEARQSLLPKARPPRATPVREAGWLVILNDDAVLLERRPPAGIWGGLLSFPEVEPGERERERAAEAAAARFGVAPVRVSALAPVYHAFTHFRLIAYPMLIEVGRGGALAGESQARWVARATAGEQALPQPVRGLLEQLSQPRGPDPAPRKRRNPTDRG